MGVEPSVDSASAGVEEGGEEEEEEEEGEVEGGEASSVVAPCSSALCPSLLGGSGAGAGVQVTWLGLMSRTRYQGDGHRVSAPNSAPKPLNPGAAPLMLAISDSHKGSADDCSDSRKKLLGPPSSTTPLDSRSRQRCMSGATSFTQSFCAANGFWASFSASMPPDAAALAAAGTVAVG